MIGPEKIKIETIFNYLSDWRNLPKYQLERRADIFFAMYMDVIISNVFKEELVDLIPEFPIRRSLLENNCDRYDSINIDYLARCRSGTAYLIELKTDEGSINESQLESYRRIVNKKDGYSEVVNGIKEISEKTKSKYKYEYLINKLKNSSVTEYSFYKQLVCIKPTKQQEDNPGIFVIDFNTIIKILKKIDDQIAPHFRAALEKWRVPVRENNHR